MKQRNNEEIVINKVEVATRLASMYVIDELKFADEIYEDENAGITTYTDKAQIIFDIAFDMYVSILEEEDKTW